MKLLFQVEIWMKCENEIGWNGEEMVSVVGRQWPLPFDNNATDEQPLTANYSM
jgi:hypothetical protein